MEPNEPTAPCRYEKFFEGARNPSPSKQPLVQPNADKEKSDSSDSNEKHVLLVDDDQRILRSLARSLDESGFKVTTSSCAAEARVIMRRDQVDAVVCDYCMPGDSGLDFLGEVRNEYPSVACFVLSGMVSGVDIAEKWAAEIGVKEVLSKPCDIDQLLQLLDEHIAE